MKAFIFFITALIWSFSRAQFYRDMADAMERKVSLRDFMGREIANAKLLKDSIAQSVLETLATRYASGNGETLRDLLYGIAPVSDMMLLSSVDDSVSSKSDALLKVADAVDFQIRSLKTLLTNMVTPILAFPIVGAICVLTSSIIASIAQDAPPAVWDGFNGQVRMLADFINGYWLVVLLSVIASVVVVIWSLPRWVGPARLNVDNLPGFKLYRDYNAALVLGAMAMMLGSGKTIMQALTDMQANSSPWLRWQLQRIIISLEDNPTEYITAFGRGLMPVKVRARLASLMESAKSFDVALITLGTKEIGRLESAVKVASQTLNWSITGVLVSLAVVLSIGQMTIANALSRESDPVHLMQQKH